MSESSGNGDGAGDGKPKVNWFAVDRAWFYEAGKRMGARGLHIYLLLLGHADEEGECFPSVKRLAKLSGLHRASVSRVIAELKRKKEIDFKRERGKRTVYYVTPVKTSRTNATTTNGTGSENATQSSRNNATESSRKNANRTRTSSEVEPGNENQARSRRRKEKEEEIQIPRSLETPEFQAAWNKWLAYRRVRRLTRNKLTLDEQLTMFEGLGSSGAVASITEAIRGGWSGVFPPKGNGTEPAKQLNVRELNLEDPT